MSPVIRVSDEIFVRLEKHAVGFDTPTGVIEKLLNHYEGIKPTTVNKAETSVPRKGKDFTRYLFNGDTYGKARLVLAVIQDYAANNPDITYDELQSTFPRELQGGSIGTIKEFDQSLIREREKGYHARHFVKPDEVIALADTKVVVTNQWGIGNIHNFIEKAESLGYTVSATNG